MIGVDTNVLLRFVLADDPKQHPIATRFFTERTKADQAFVPMIVLIEAVWFLQRVAKIDAARIGNTFSRLLAVDGVRFEDHKFLMGLFADEMAVKEGIADRLIARACEKAGCHRTVTFDRRAAKHITSMELLA